jgi:hypothetical protein
MQSFWTKWHLLCNLFEHCKRQVRAYSRKGLTPFQKSIFPFNLPIYRIRRKILSAIVLDVFISCTLAGLQWISAAADDPVCHFCARVDK